MFKKINIDFELLHNVLNECKLNGLYLNIINVLRTIFDTDFDATIEKEDV